MTALAHDQFDGVMGPRRGGHDQTFKLQAITNEATLAVALGALHEERRHLSDTDYAAHTAAVGHQVAGQFIADNLAYPRIADLWQRARIGTSLDETIRGTCRYRTRQLVATWSNPPSELLRAFTHDIESDCARGLASHIHEQAAMSKTFYARLLRDTDAARVVANLDPSEFSSYLSAERVEGALRRAFRANPAGDDAPTALATVLFRIAWD